MSLVESIRQRIAPRSSADLAARLAVLDAEIVDAQAKLAAGDATAKDVARLRTERAELEDMRAGAAELEARQRAKASAAALAARRAEFETLRESIESVGEFEAEIAKEAIAAHERLTALDKRILAYAIARREQTDRARQLADELGETYYPRERSYQSLVNATKSAVRKAAIERGVPNDSVDYAAELVSAAWVSRQGAR